MINLNFQSEFIFASGAISEIKNNLFSIAKIGSLKKKIKILDNFKSNFKVIDFIITSKNLTELKKIIHLYPSSNFMYLDRKFQLNKVLL